MIKANAEYKINSNGSISIFVETKNDFFGGISPIMNCIDFFDDLYSFIDSECEKRGWRLERLSKA